MRSRAAPSGAKAHPHCSLAAHWLPLSHSQLHATMLNLCRNQLFPSKSVYKLLFPFSREKFPNPFWVVGAGFASLPSKKSVTRCRWLHLQVYEALAWPLLIPGTGGGQLSFGSGSAKYPVAKGRRRCGIENGTAGAITKRKAKCERKCLKCMEEPKWSSKGREAGSRVSWHAFGWVLATGKVRNGV